jgi:hypothetical protein
MIEKLPVLFMSGFDITLELRAKGVTAANEAVKLETLAQLPSFLTLGRLEA